MLLACRWRGSLKVGPFANLGRFSLSSKSTWRWPKMFGMTRTKTRGARPARRSRLEEKFAVDKVALCQVCFELRAVPSNFMPLAFFDMNSFFRPDHTG